MRKGLYCLMVLGLSGCVVGPQGDPVPVTTELPKRPVAPPSQASPQRVQRVIAAVPLRAPELTHRELAGVVCEGVAFDARSHRLVVADQADGPGSRWASSDLAVAGAVPGGPLVRRNLWNRPVRNFLVLVAR